MMDSHDSLKTDSTEVTLPTIFALPNDTLEDVGLLSHSTENSPSFDKSQDTTDSSDEFFDAPSPTKPILKRSSTSPSKPIQNRLQLALRFVETADFETTLVLQKACSERMDSLRTDVHSRVYKPQNKHQGQTSCALETSNTVALLESHQSLLVLAKAPTSNPAIPARLNDPHGFHPSNSFHVANSSPTDSAVLKTRKFHESRPSCSALDNVKKHTRQDSRSSLVMAMKRSDSLVTQAGDKFRGGFLSLKDRMKHKATTVTSSPTLKTLPSFSNEDDLMSFDSPKKSFKKLRLVREESPLGTANWLVKVDEESRNGVEEDDDGTKEGYSKESTTKKATKENTKDSGAKEKLPALMLSLARADEDSFLGKENIAQYTTSPNETSPPPKTSILLPETPISQPMTAAPKFLYPPRVSSLNSSLVSINPYLERDYFSASTDALYDGNKMSGTAEEEDVSMPNVQDFQPIGNSHLKQGFRRIASDGTIIPRSITQSSMGPEKTAPKPPPKDEPVDRRASQNRQSPRNNGLPARGLSSLARRAASSFRRNRKGTSGSKKSLGRRM